MVFNMTNKKNNRKMILFLSLRIHKFSVDLYFYKGHIGYNFISFLCSVA